jgi:hypothetical protein
MREADLSCGVKILGPRYLNKFFKEMRKSICEMGEPWGIPVLTRDRGCLLPSNANPNCLPEKKLSTQLSSLSDIYCTNKVPVEQATGPITL